ncbi:MAG: protein kinase [Acidobacteriota bacterium]
MSERIGRFELLEQLGSGAVGVVWRARDTRLRREVALKLIREERSSDRTVRERFIREFHAAASLNHPGIATLFEADQTPEGRVYCVYEIVDGETLTERIRRGDLDTEECVDIGLQLAEAMAAAHRAGIVHRDIKPDNVMLTAEGVVKVLDFGLARTAGQSRIASRAEDLERQPVDEHATYDEGLRTRAGALVGTPRYMSPEQAAGLEVDARTDVFSAGLVLYELATGEAAFTGDSVPETLRHIQVEEHRPVQERNPSIDRRLGAVIDRALAKAPDDRYSSGAELALALRQVSRRASGGAWRWWSAAAGLLVLVAAGVWFSSRPALAFTDRDRLLIADVDNRTDEEVFDFALTAAIEQDLEQSRYARVYDRALVVETLKLLRQPADAFIDEELGRDICRFAGVRALVVPRILSVGNTYEVQASLVDPATGRHVKTLRVTVEGREAVLLTAVDDLARQLRETLGESLASIEATDLPVAQHTTSSWEALQSATLAARRWQEARYREAAVFFERAIEQDPRFMAAHGSLGLLKIQFLGEPEEGKQLLREALELTDGVTDVERMMIGAVNKEFVDADLEGALADYEVTLDLYPDTFSAMNNKGQLLYRLQRTREALEVFDAAHELQPTSSHPLWAIARIQLWVMHDAIGVETTVQKIVSLHPDAPEAQHMLAWSYVGQRRYDKAEAGMRRVLELDSRHRLALPNLAHLLMRQGRAAEAVPIYRQVLEGVVPPPTPATVTWNTLALALALRAAGETAEADVLLAERIEAVQETGFNLAVLAAALGRSEQAAAWVAATDEGTVPAERLSEMAEVLTLMGRTDEALDALERASAAGYNDIFFWSIMPALAGLRDEPRFLALTESHSPAG